MATGEAIFVGVLIGLAIIVVPLAVAIAVDGRAKREYTPRPSPWGGHWIVCVGPPPEDVLDVNGPATIYGHCDVCDLEKGWMARVVNRSTVKKWDDGREWRRSVMAGNVELAPGVMGWQVDVDGWTDVTSEATGQGVA